MGKFIEAGGIRQHVRTWGPIDGTPVLLVHGNCSSGGYWEPFVRDHLGGDATELRIVAPDLRGYGDTDTAPVDATRGLRDFADDLDGLLGAEGVFGSEAPVVVVGHSMGCGVAMQFAIDHADRVAGLVLTAPVSPYGFGGTKDLEGTPTTPDFAGTGGGTANPDFVARLDAADRSGDEQTSPRAVLRSAYVADADIFGADEEAMLDTVLSTATGVDNYPGDSAPSDNWPMVGPGERGVLNTMSPKWFSVAEDLVALEPKPPVEWLWGTADAIVSDTSLFDLAYLGQLGVVPGWPGAEACPPQPMVGQTRAVLERYAAAGGRFTETRLEGCGHSPHVERPDTVVEALHRLTSGRP
ncbi:alpha/beta hydrolase [Knoellia subterranea]|uniref:Alpha/beta hydrolase n=1 Tax=Knoellia subterranea KCTC 19937 TaxID=1385521 RepID=A0A0A0JRZ8_9MICO|nr:alpha/beta hydrolase [Knoellia subterranea]KGN38842.1 alpha/beta hydrolase [Knoellia subterranea KCTC 19937]